MDNEKKRNWLWQKLIILPEFEVYRKIQTENWTRLKIKWMGWNKIFHPIHFKAYLQVNKKFQIQQACLIFHYPLKMNGYGLCLTVMLVTTLCFMTVTILRCGRIIILHQHKPSSTSVPNIDVANISHSILIGIPDSAKILLSTKLL